MIIHPELRALRVDDTPQRVAQEALIAIVGGWKKAPHFAAIVGQLADFAKGDDISGLPLLAALFDAQSTAARDLSQDVSRLLASALARHRLGHVPFRHFADDTISTLQLAKSGNATLSLVAIDGEGLARKPGAVTADFSPSEVWEQVLCGTGQAELIDRGTTGADHAELDCSALKMAPGVVIVRDARLRNMQLRSVEGCLVSLRLQRRLADAGPTMEYDLATGKLVHLAAGNPQDSRIELMMALLGRMERSDAAPVLAEIAQSQSSTALRWQGLRECLALDTAAGFAALSVVSQSAEDDLAPAAGALRSQLIESYPQLQELDKCHA